MILLRPILALAAAAGLVFAAPAMAHVKLLSSQPGASATVSKPVKIVLTFNEKILAQMSGMDVVMTGMPGMANHAPMKMSGFKTAVSKDGKTLTATFNRPLAAGSYQVNWRAVSADTHRIAGRLSFSVK